MKYNPQHILKWVPSLIVDGASALANGAAVDTRGFEYAVIPLQFGAVADTAVLTVKVQESDVSGSGFADVPDAVYTVTEASDDNTVKPFEVRLHGRKRYLRIVTTYGGSGAYTLTAPIGLMHPQYEADDHGQTYSVIV